MRIADVNPGERYTLDGAIVWAVWVGRYLIETDTTNHYRMSFDGHIYSIRFRAVETDDAQAAVYIIHDDDLKQARDGANSIVRTIESVQARRLKDNAKDIAREAYVSRGAEQVRRAYQHTRVGFRDDARNAGRTAKELAAQIFARVDVNTSRWDMDEGAGVVSFLRMVLPQDLLLEMVMTWLRFQELQGVDFGGSVREMAAAHEMYKDALEHEANIGYPDVTAVKAQLIAEWYRDNP